MDLGVCPRCGEEWAVGSEFCNHCGFVAIGAGLTRLPRKKKKRIRKYREPGSSTPFLSVFLFFSIFVWVYESRPWERHWEQVRVWFGAEPTKSVDGNWEVQSVIALDAKQRPIVAPGNLITGEMEFSRDGKAKLVLHYPPVSQLVVQANYDLEGTRLILSRLATDPDLPKIPKKVDMHLSWQGDDTVVAAVAPSPGAPPTAEMYLHFLGGGKPHLTQTFTLKGGDD
jgi:hypothetical protein